MKNVFVLFFAFVMGSMVLTSCGKDETPTPNNDIENPEFFFSCKVDNADYMSEGILAYGAEFSSSINVYGLTDLEGSNVIYVALPKDVKPGTYDFNSEVFAIVSMGEKSYTTNLEGGEGVVEITKFDGTNIQGTFSFEAIDFDDYETKAVVTNGSFNVDIRL